MEGMRTDRLSLLVDQLDRAREIAEVRLTGLGDEEYLWEPAPGAWSIRRRGEAASSRPFGPGEWVLDRGDPEIPAAEYAEIDRQVRGGMTVAKVATDWGVSHQRVEEILNRVGPPEPDLAPVTTIAWRVGHLHSDFAGRWEWTFGERRRQPDLLVDFTPSATVAVARQRRGHDPRAARHARLRPIPLGFGSRRAVHRRHLGGQPRVHPPHGRGRAPPRPVARPLHALPIGVSEAAGTGYLDRRYRGCRPRRNAAAIVRARGRGPGATLGPGTLAFVGKEDQAGVAAGGDDRPVQVHGLLGLGRRAGVVGSVDDQDRAVQAIREQQRAERVVDMGDGPVALPFVLEPSGVSVRL
jgi:hypothetical protein